MRGPVILYMYGGWFKITLRWLIQRLNKNTGTHFFKSNIGLISNSQSNTSKCFFNNQIHMLRSHHSLVYSKTDVCTDCTTLPWKTGSLSVFLGQGHFTILFKILKRIHSLPLCTELYIDRQTDVECVTSLTSPVTVSLFQRFRNKGTRGGGGLLLG